MRRHSRTTSDATARHLDQASGHGSARRSERGAAGLAYRGVTSDQSAELAIVIPFPDLLVGGARAFESSPPGQRPSGRPQPSAVSETASPNSAVQDSAVQDSAVQKSVMQNSDREASNHVAVSPETSIRGAQQSPIQEPVTQEPTSPARSVPRRRRRVRRVSRVRSCPSPAIRQELPPAVRHGAEPTPLPAAHSGQLRLTRRGRVVVAIALILMLAAVIGGASLAVRAATTGPAERTATVMVRPGQTLWTIAEEVAPTSDLRATVDRIADLNGLSGSAGLRPGQSLIVPVLR